MILRLAVLIQYRRVTHSQTDTQTHDDGYYLRIACAARVKILVLSHALGDLGVMYTAHLWLAGKRMVDFLLDLIEFFFFSLALMAAVLLSEICRNRPFSEGVGHYVRIFFIYGPLDRGMMWLQLFR